MNFHFGSNTQTGKSYYFEVEVGPNSESFESYMKRIFAYSGLFTIIWLKTSPI
jgi:hypothetical protein